MTYDAVGNALREGAKKAKKDGVQSAVGTASRSAASDEDDASGIEEGISRRPLSTGETLFREGAGISRDDRVGVSISWRAEGF